MAVSEGMGWVTRIFDMHKNGTMGSLQRNPSCYTQSVMSSLTFEGDELYTVVGERCKPSDSEGWTCNGTSKPIYH